MEIRARRHRGLANAVTLGVLVGDVGCRRRQWRIDRLSRRAVFLQPFPMFLVVDLAEGLVQQLIFQNSCQDRAYVIQRQPGAADAVALTFAAAALRLDDVRKECGQFVEHPRRGFHAIFQLGGIDVPGFRQRAEQRHDLCQRPFQNSVDLFFSILQPQVIIFACWIGPMWKFTIRWWGGEPGADEFPRCRIAIGLLIGKHDVKQTQLHHVQRIGVHPRQFLHLGGRQFFAMECVGRYRKRPFLDDALIHLVPNDAAHPVESLFEGGQRVGFLAAQFLERILHHRQSIEIAAQKPVDAMLIEAHVLVQIAARCAFPTNAPALLVDRDIVFVAQRFRFRQAHCGDKGRGPCAQNSNSFFFLGSGHESNPPSAFRLKPESPKFCRACSA